MNSVARSMIGAAAGCVVMAMAVASPAGAQPPPPAGQGPLVVQKISSGFVLTPEVRYTELNHTWGTQIGVSGGWLYDDSIFVGGGVFSLVGGADDQQLTYGGFITGWSAPISSAVRVGVRGLFGWGHAETFERWTDPGYCHRGNCYGPTTQQAWVFQDFMVFEPSVNATIRVAPQVAVEIGGGYRITGNNYYGWDGHVSGGFGSVGIRVGVF